MFSCRHPPNRICKRGWYVFIWEFLFTVLHARILCFCKLLKMISLWLGFPTFWKHTIPICKKIGFYFRHFRVAGTLKESLHIPKRSANVFIWIYTSHAELWWRVCFNSIYNYFMNLLVLSNGISICIYSFLVYLSGLFA